MSIFSYHSVQWKILIHLIISWYTIYWALSCRRFYKNTGLTILKTSLSCHEHLYWVERCLIGRLSLTRHSEIYIYFELNFKTLFCYVLFTVEDVCSNRQCQNNARCQAVLVANQICPIPQCECIDCWMGDDCTEGNKTRQTDFITMWLISFSEYTFTSYHAYNTYKFQIISVDPHPLFHLAILLSIKSVWRIYITIIFSFM